MHPRVSLHQVAFADEDVSAFLDHCAAIGVANATLATPVETPRRAGIRVSTLNHLFVDEDRLRDAIGAAATLGSDSVYLLTGGHDGLDWEAAADRFAGRIVSAREAAVGAGVRLLVENANAFNADIHIAHTLADTILLAETAAIGVCVDLHGCWAEAGLRAQFRNAMPLIGLVQVSDYVLGDRSTPCRAVPGDGVIPLERLIGDLLDAGYAGLFDLELIGLRIAAEGARTATKRGAEWLSELLARWGA